MTRKTKDLPFDVIYQILCQLPTKSLLRFRCLSNLYRETIDDLEFIRTHNQLGRTLLFKQEDMTVCELEESDGGILRPTIVSPLTYERSRFLCSAQGFILLLQDNKLCLCNPSRRESIVLPSAPIDMKKTFVDNGRFLWLRIGLGFDSTKYEYKIVCNLTENIKDTDTDTLIYSSKSKSWKLTSSSLPPPYDNFEAFYNRGCGVFVNGSVYWVQYKYHSQSSARGFLLISFDIKTEEFARQEFSLPILNSDTLCHPALMELGGCLAMADSTEVFGYTSPWRLWTLIEGNWEINNIVDIDNQDERCCFDQETYRAYYYVNLVGFSWTCSRKFIKKYSRLIHRCKETLLSLNNF